MIRRWALSADEGHAYVHDVVREVYGEDVSISECTWLGGGVVNRVANVALEYNGAGSHTAPVPSRCVVKLIHPYWHRAKTINEVAAMCLVRTRTSVPVPRVLAFNAEGGSTPEYIVMEYVEGELLERVYKSGSMSGDEVERVLEEWGRCFLELRTISFGQFGAFAFRRDGEGKELTKAMVGEMDEEAFAERVYVDALASNAGVTLGPFDTYAKYACHKIEMFWPVLRDTFKDGRYEELIRRLSRYVEQVATYRVEAEAEGEQEGGSTTGWCGCGLVHTDASMRNILVRSDAGGGGRVIAAVFDWEFAVSGPYEEEITFPLGGMGGLAEEHKESFMNKLTSLGIAPPKTALSGGRRDHTMVYAAMITLCHCHLWELEADEEDRRVAEAITWVEHVLARKGI